MSAVVNFHSQISVIPTHIKQQMRIYTWHPGCPVSLADLRYLQLSYWGYDDQTHAGVLIINKQIASEVAIIFKQLFIAKFPIEKMQPLDVYQGNDEESMADNNTVGFNCRTNTSQPSEFSQHSYGTAIDINPLVNPYIKNAMVLPAAGKKYLIRNPKTKGIIIKNNVAYTIFIQHGWHWGGDWQDLKDYQHFQKTL